MKESTQTLWFLAASVAAVLLAVFSRPSDATFEVDALVGQTLTRPFESDEAKSLRIVRFDEDSATLSDFEVAERDGVWSLPSKGGYPADAQRQMAEASTGVMDLKILEIATQSAADHSDYGVIEPSTELEVGQTGVGKRVVLSKEDGSGLVDVVIGKEVKDAEDHHYVRRTNQDAVFVVEIDPDSFSTSFEDWIEDDLLGLNTFDIARVQLKDYSAELVMDGFRPTLAMDPRADLTLSYNESESKWEPDSLKEFERSAGGYTPFELTEGQELNAEALGQLKASLEDLKIVDVERKPAGLSADLKAGDDFYKNQESVLSLVRRGFAPTSNQSGQTEVLSSEGEVIVTQKDGVEYVLRFGKLQMDAAQQETGDAAEGEETPSDEQGVSRYLFVMARYNGAMIPLPELEDPPEPTGVDEDEQADDPEESANETSEEASDPDPSAGNKDQDEEADEQEAEREALLDRNKRAQDEYEDKVAAAQKRVDQLNARFGDWYYVISNDVYKKVALGRDEVISQSEPAEEDAAEAEPDNNPLSGLPSLPGTAVPSSDDESSDNAAE